MMQLSVARSAELATAKRCTLDLRQQGRDLKKKEALMLEGLKAETAATTVRPKQPPQLLRHGQRQLKHEKRKPARGSMRR